MKSARWNGVEARRLGCGVYCEILSARLSMKDAKTKRAPIREQIEDVMVNGVNVMNGRSEVGTATRQRRGEAASNQGKEASKQAVGVNEQSWREDEERLQSVAFGAWPQ
jgi:hypothetical protein